MKRYALILMLLFWVGTMSGCAFEEEDVPSTRKSVPRTTAAVSEVDAPEDRESAPRTSVVVVETDEPADREIPTETFTASTETAWKHLEALADEIGPRLAGSEEESLTAAYIESAFAAYGYDVTRQDFTFWTEDDEELESSNVIAVKPGESTEEIVVGAHYDSVDDGDGADDNASGVAVLLAIAELLVDEETPYTVRFIAFGAEETDMDGSHHYVETMSRTDRRNTVGMINQDSLIAGDILYVYGDAGSGTMRDWIIAAAADEGLDLDARTAAELDNPDGTPCDCADYGPFQEAGIPFAYFEATNWDLSPDAMVQVSRDFGKRGYIRHTKYDTVAYIDTTFPNRIDEHFEVCIALLYDVLTQWQSGAPH
ncbi:MAG: M20/M25/M40 family metallo-hydrolase [Anaerolineae bacterium]|nr:M20/M25/M40 family metallo-hydrolase [Anaerolineae bacterium]